MPVTYHITEDIHEFFNEYYQYNYDYDKFRSIADDIEENFKYGGCLFDTGYSDHIFFVAMDGNIPVGLLKFKVGGSDSFANPGFCNWVCFISVRSEYRNKGIGTELREMLFKYCSEHDMNILSSGFTVLGHMYNLKGYIRLAKKYNVEYSYQNCVGHPNFNDFEGMDEQEYKAYYDKHVRDWSQENVIINRKKNETKT